MAQQRRSARPRRKWTVSTFLLAGLLVCIAGLPAVAADSDLVADVVSIIGDGAVHDEEAGLDAPSSTYRAMASRKNLTLYVDSESGGFAVKNTQSDQVWWSVPQNVERDTLVKGKNKVILQSLLVIDYFDPESNTIDSVGSYSGAVQRSGVELETIANGVRIRYDFTGIKIRISLEVVLENGAFVVTVPTERIEEYGTNYLSGIQLLPNMGAGFADEDGWMFVPDGSGATATFNNGRQDAASYSASVYGTDANQTVIRHTEVTQNALLPVFGIKSGNKALFGIITQSDGNAVINAAVSGGKSMFNTVNSQFLLRRVDQYDMGQSTGQSRVINLFSTAALSQTPIQVRYYLLEGENASLGGMATVCRTHYQTAGMVNTKMSDIPPMYIELLGAVYKKAPVLGIPTNSVLPVTDFSAAGDILQALKQAGIAYPVVQYHNWNDDQIKGKICDSASPSRQLGGTGAFKQLLQTEMVDIYPDLELTYVKNWQWGYGKSDYAAKSIKNVPTELYEHNIATFFADSRFPAKWLLSPLKLETIGARYLASFQKLQHPYVDMGSTASVLYSDYSVRTHTRDDSKNNLMSLYQTFRDAGNQFLASGGNGYAAIYAEHIVDVPSESSHYDMFDQSVPFYQMVFHGVKYLGSEAINHAADSRNALLHAVQTGSLLRYSLIDPANRHALDGTMYDDLYSADWTYWMPEMATQYLELKPFYEKTLSLAIRDFRYLEDEVSLTVYEDGTEVIVNFSTKPFVYRNETVAAEGYRIWMETEE